MDSARAHRRFAAQFSRVAGKRQGLGSRRTLIVFVLVFGGIVCFMAYWFHYYVLFMHMGDDKKSLSLQKEATPSSPIRYWEKYAGKSYAAFPLRPKGQPNHDRYITFEDDTGGWNNIRMAFEAFVAVAKITGRTLVLPPRCRFYLLDRGPITTFAKKKRGETSSYDDYYDFSYLVPHIQIITTEEFLRREKGRLGIPEELVEKASVPQLVSNGHHTEYFLWLRESKDTIIWPSGPRYASDFWIESRKAIHPEKLALHFPMHVSKNLRYLSGVPALFHKVSTTARNRIRKFIRGSLVYGKHIVKSAEAYIRLLGGFEHYTSLHIRRNELQYKNVFVPGDVSATNFVPFVNDNEVLYLATDEMSQGFFDEFKKRNVTVFMMKDLREKVAEMVGPVHPKYEGMIEQLVCSGARVFAGTPYSSYSAHIMRLRGYIHASAEDPVQRACLFHTTNYFEASNGLEEALRKCKSAFEGEVVMSDIVEEEE